MEEKARYSVRKLGEVQQTFQESLPGLAHLYAQLQYHDSAFIVANRKGLLAIKDAIEHALQDGKATTELVPADGEGYHLHVVLDDSDWQGESWQTAAMPYTDEVAQACSRTAGYTRWPEEE